MVQRPQANNAPKYVALPATLTGLALLSALLAFLGLHWSGPINVPPPRLLPRDEASNPVLEPGPLAVNRNRAGVGFLSYLHGALGKDLTGLFLLFKSQIIDGV